MMTAFKSLSLLVVGLAVGALPHLSTAACSDEAGVCRPAPAPREEARVGAGRFSVREPLREYSYM